MKLSEELTWRGFVGQHTFDDLGEIDRGDRTFYLGVDPSADSMTIGNLAVLILCLHFAKAGHQAILLAGGATGMAGGDPDGKDETRAKLSPETLAKNVAGIEAQFQNLFRDQKFELVNNYDWFKDIHYLDFLRDVGWHFSITQLTDREFVKSRIGTGGKGINYSEFSYALIQGYDFLHLFRNRNATIQLCAVDQFGNCAVGMSMIRKLENQRADVFAMPLIINKSTGKKFGKSEGGAVWLDPAKTSSYQFYQFWLNVDDDSVIDHLKIYTFLSKEDIAALAENHFTNPGERAAQKTLAREVTTLVHGRAATESVERVTRVLFDSANFQELSDADLDNLAREIPTINCHPEPANCHPGEPLVLNSFQDVSGSSLSSSSSDSQNLSSSDLIRGSRDKVDSRVEHENDTTTVVSALVGSGIAASNSEAQRLIKQNAIAVNGQKITADQTIVEKSLIKKGKNQFVLVR